ncbi:hypothetical protein C7I36_14525 [Zobellella taiwanensis]|uniref:Uncharacterized protein n=1 Tax=Zobellella taiwanensis TaxID=347535 RepID=A0A2P7QJN4_9GAMM|nr:hypothetical protein [Zobellella taiwanensis]PSJ38169.1 hypothetical protein C7I36_14525 [Zobellella taiwanensis]
MHSPIAVIRGALLRFLLLVIGLLLVPATVFIDLAWLDNGLSESSLTEGLQALLILCSALMCAHGARVQPERRGFLILVAGFFCCLFIRELDYLFDRLHDGLWQLLALTTTLVSLLAALPHRQGLLPAMARATQSVAFNYVLCGLALLLFFSRVFGTGALWDQVMASLGAEAPHLLKTVVQEGLELCGYGFIFHGSLSFWLQRRQAALVALPHREPAASVQANAA